VIRVIIELELVFPYKISMGILVEFCRVWDSRIIEGGTKNIKAIISMPATHFKKIFGTNPREKEFLIPSGMGHFVSNLKVKDIQIKEDK